MEEALPSIRSMVFVLVGRLIVRHCRGRVKGLSGGSALLCRVLVVHFRK
jgi:hypothetical protein